MKFKRTPNIEYNPKKQEQVDYTSIDKDLPKPDTDQQEKSRADIIAEEYDRTLEFMDFLIDNIDKKIHDVVVEVDPEQHPEVWMAMKRLYGKTAKPFLSGKNYSEALEALDAVSELELEEAKEENTGLEDEFIEAIKEATGNQGTLDTEAPEMSVASEDDRAIEEAMEDRRLVIGDQPTRPRTPAWWKKFRRKFTTKKIIRFFRGKRTDTGYLKSAGRRVKRPEPFTRDASDLRGDE